MNITTTPKDVTTMKTMTCQQLGGPCSLEHHGASADEVIKLQDKHLKDAVKSGDEAHVPAREAMAGRWKKPIAGMGWYRDVKKQFAALPSD